MHLHRRALKPTLVDWRAAVISATVADFRRAYGIADPSDGYRRRVAKANGVAPEEVGRFVSTFRFGGSPWFSDLTGEETRNG